MDHEALDPVADEDSDEYLVARARAGDDTAWTVIVERHMGQVWKLSRSMIRDQHAAEDVAQETFRVVKEKLAEYRGHGALCGWIKTICRRQALDELRRRERKAREVSIDDSPNLGVPPGVPVEERWVQLLDIERALSTLDHDEREALLASEAGYSSDELARLLGTAPTTVRSRKARARARLLRELDDGYGRRNR